MIKPLNNVVDAQSQNTMLNSPARSSKVSPLITGSFTVIMILTGSLMHAVASAPFFMNCHPVMQSTSTNFPSPWDLEMCTPSAAATRKMQL